MFKRPTSMAAAFVNAAVKAEQSNKDLSQPKVDHWVARRVAHNATERGQFGMTTEYDKRPVPPQMRASLHHEEDFSDVPY